MGREGETTSTDLSKWKVVSRNTLPWGGRGVRVESQEDRELPMPLRLSEKAAGTPDVTQTPHSFPLCVWPEEVWP